MRGKTAVVLLALLLAGCAAPSSEAASAAAPAQVPQAEPAESMESAWVEYSARPLLETEIAAAYDQAVRVYGWFDLAPLPLSGESAVVEGRRYYKVDMDGIEDLEDLRAYLRGVFSQELADRLLDGRPPASNTGKWRARSTPPAGAGSGTRAWGRPGWRRNSWTRAPTP